jgi:apolipoprotein N-acyltransferase
MIRACWLELCFGGLLLLFVAIWEWQFAGVVLMLVMVTGAARRILAASVPILFNLAFPPFSWPTWFFCLAPMLWLWRDQELRLSRLRLVAEAVAIGFAMGWFSTEFVRAGIPAWGWLVHAAACFVFSLQFLAVAMTIRLMRKQRVIIAGAVTAVVAVFGELIEAWWGVSWSVSNFSLTVGATPLAQWSQRITPFGVAGILFLVNFLFCLDTSAERKRQWIGPAIGIVILCIAWCGGLLIAVNTPIPQLSFSAVLVQLHRKVPDKEPWRPWLHLDHLTRNALQENHDVDVIVWPESCLSQSWNQLIESDSYDIETQLTVQGFAKHLSPAYRTNCLVGAIINARGTTFRYGLEVAEVRRYNCGCLISNSGEITHHEKLDLVPFKEGLPWLLDCSFVRNRILPRLQLKEPLAYGRKYSPLTFRDRDGNLRTIAVSVCYESLLPWLPQYRASSTVDAIIHIVYDGNSADHPGMMERHIRACQFRAIETRKWNLVCSTWAGTAIIDPTGRIVRQLPPVEGVLRTDTL